jgi:hypothetical protein
VPIYRDITPPDEAMVIASAPMLFISAALGEFTDVWAGSGPRLFYASRLVAALLTATLVPLLIDRRARRQ